jgi:hypothetical protein
MFNYVIMGGFGKWVYWLDVRDLLIEKLRYESSVV